MIFLNRDQVQNTIELDKIINLIEGFIIISSPNFFVFVVL